MKTFGWVILILEFISYLLSSHEERLQWLLPVTILDGAFIISATALIIAGNFKHDKKDGK